MPGTSTGLGRRLAIAIAAGGLLLSAGVAARPPLATGLAQERSGLEGRLRASGGEAETIAFYASRDFQPIWLGGGRVNPAGLAAIQALEDAELHGLPSERYLDERLLHLADGARQDRLGSLELEELEVRLSSAFPRFVQDLQRPAPANDPIRVDLHAARSPWSTKAILAHAADGSGETSGVAELLRMHPDYDQLAQALSVWRARWSRLPGVSLPSGRVVSQGQRDERIRLLRARLGVVAQADEDRLDEALAGRLAEFQLWHGLDPNGQLDAATVTALNTPAGKFEQRILVNLDRLRALPAEPGERHLLVNVAAGELTAMEGDRTVRIMRVIVGRPTTPTPMLAGVVRYAVATPYWNIPQDLLREQIAPAVLKDGPAAFHARKLEALTDWSPEARSLAPESIDWKAVRAGEQRLRVRQKPGPHNMMGEVKFMLPNDLGIYLHDTPDRSLFDRESRALSAGCVRLEDAGWLGRWLFGADLSTIRTGEPEQRIDLDRPTPVYLLYQTVEPRPGGGLLFHQDLYGHDPETL